MATLKLFFSIFILVSANAQNSLTCETTSPQPPTHHCNQSSFQTRCETFAIFRTNSYFSSLYNLSFYLGINPFLIKQANGFPPNTEILPLDHPLLIPIDCDCNGNFFQSALTKLSIKGESFTTIVEALEGLTTCRDIEAKNPNVSQWNLDENYLLNIAVRCACPSEFEANSGIRFLLSYPVKQGDTISSLAFGFNTTRESIVSTNKLSKNFDHDDTLFSFTTLLIPVNRRPNLGLLVNPSGSILNFPQIHPKKKKIEMWKIGVFVGVIGTVVGITIAIVAAVFTIKMRRKKLDSCKETVDMELQHLSLSVRTTSDKKMSFDTCQDHLESQMRVVHTPHKISVESYTIDELRKATEDFSSSNHIEGSVYHGRLSGKNLAIKITSAENISKIDHTYFHQTSHHHHPNIVRLLGTCLMDGYDSFLVLEYAKNGSLKDWLHGGLAIKSQFISSCYCFLTWKQRVNICFHIASGLNYMHHVLNPSYVHRNMKSSNIFLDEDFNAKIGNFGMEKFLDESAENPQLNSGANAYLAPEFVREGVISPSIDIYAYGVILMEILSGKIPVMGQNVGFIKSMVESENGEKFRDWIDKALGENYSFEVAVTLLNIAKTCIEDDPGFRPSAGEIVEKLSRFVEELTDGEHVSISESSCRPLVNAGATNNL